MSRPSQLSCLAALLVVCLAVQAQAGDGSASRAQSATKRPPAPARQQEKQRQQRQQPPHRKQPKVALQEARDEFNTTESLTRSLSLGASGGSGGGVFFFGDELAGGPATLSEPALPSRSPALKRLLLRLELAECCPAWAELRRAPEIQDEQRKLHGKARLQLRSEDLLAELGQVFANITQRSIDGQEGQSEWQKYYKFYDNVQYYLRLVRVCEDYLGASGGGGSGGGGATLALGPQAQPAPPPPGATRRNSSESATSATGGAPQAEAAAAAAAAVLPAVAARALQQPATTSGLGGRLKGLLPGDQELALADRDFKRQFRRQLKGIEFRVSQDPIVSSFISELREQPAHFEHYENFIRNTQFGQRYARNVSLVRESLQVLELLGAHLESLSFPSNLTRPSRVYQMIRGMARELFKTKRELLDSVSGRVLAQRDDVKRAFNDLDILVANRPDVRMLGDEFNFDPSPPGLEFSANVRQLTRLLDLYTANNMTQLTFYNELSSLPEEFILLGLAIAREYETRELPQYNRFDSDYYDWELSTHRHHQQQAQQQLHQQQNQHQQQHFQHHHNSLHRRRRLQHQQQLHERAQNSSAADSARQGARPFFSRILFGG